MKEKLRQDRALLVEKATAVAARLKANKQGTCVRVRVRRATKTDTDGWRVIIGDLGKKQPRLEVWYDRFSGYPERKLCACFESDERGSMTAITKRVTRKLFPVRIVKVKDIKLDTHFELTDRLAPSEFNVPIREEYDDGQTFFSIYDPTRESAKNVSSQFCNRAAAFFEDVARSLPLAKGADEHRDVYPQYENRKKVVSHLQRERSRLLATERKIQDNYVCQVCDMSFKDVYGKILGQDFAEAHHLVSLSQLRQNVKTSLNDLRTVCSNCHRMLHRMDGKPKDIVKLRAIIRKHR